MCSITVLQETTSITDVYVWKKSISMGTENLRFCRWKKQLQEAEPGTYEIKVTCKVDVVLHSVTIQ